MEEEDEVDIINENGQVYLEFTEVIEDLTSQYEIIAEHAEGVNSFMTSLLESVENGEATVNIPAEIDPEESSIRLEAAIDKMDDICEIDMKTAQRFLQKVKDFIARMENGTRPYNKLIEMKKDIESMIKIYTDLKRKISEQRQSLAINQFYEYLYVDEEDQILSARNPHPKSTLHGNDAAATMRQNFNIIPYGNDAHHEDDDMTSYDVSPESSAQDQNPGPEPSTKRTPSVTARKAGHFPHVPTFAIVFIVLSVAVFTLIAVVLCICVTQKRKQAKSPPPSLAEETKKEPISIVTIPVDCHKPIQHINAEKNDLPCYLDVICDKLQA